MNRFSVICCKCNLEMIPENHSDIGVPVIEMAGKGEAMRPYRAWSGDRVRCPKCGYQVIAKFGNPQMGHSSIQVPPNAVLVEE